MQGNTFEKGKWFWTDKKQRAAHWICDSNIMQQQSMWPCFGLYAKQIHMSSVAAVRVVQWLGSEDRACEKTARRWSSLPGHVQLLTRRSPKLLSHSYPTDLFHCSDFWTDLLSWVRSISYNWLLILEPFLLKGSLLVRQSTVCFSVFRKEEHNDKTELSDDDLPPSFMLRVAKTWS